MAINEVHWYKAKKVNPYTGRRGLQVEEAAAKTAKVRAKLTSAQSVIYARARAQLARHRDTGMSRITRSAGELDRFVNLDDPRGAAHGILRTTGALRNSAAGRAYLARGGRPSRAYRARQRARRRTVRGRRLG